MPDSEHLPIGICLDDCEVECVLGAGGFGVTYRAIDRTRDAYVALKEYFPKLWAVRDYDGGVQVASAQHEHNFRWGLDRFIGEAQTLAQFRNRNIVRVDKIFGAMGTAYIQLEYVEGPNLEQWAASRGSPPTQDELDAFAAALLSALSTIHRGEVLHRDIAPKNLIINRQGLPVVIDFGSARQIVGALTQNVTVLVTPHFAPQEQYIASGNDQGPWTDIYSAAATLYWLISGAPPASAPARAIDGVEVEPLVGRFGNRYRTQFLAAVEWGLAFLPQDRPRSVVEWSTQLLPSKNVHGGRGLRMNEHTAW
jgi:serine/threonine protein kinase